MIFYVVNNVGRSFFRFVTNRAFDRQTGFSWPDRVAYILHAARY